MENDNRLMVEFLHYNLWANRMIIDACERLLPEQLAAGTTGVYGSIHETLMHIIRSEASYYRRISGVTLQPPFAWADPPGMAQLREFAEQVERALIEAAGRMSFEDTLERDWKDVEWQAFPPRFKAVGLLIQVINHGVEHRTNITTTMVQHGIEPPYIDGWEYMRLNPARMGMGGE